MNAVEPSTSPSGGDDVALPQSSAELTATYLEPLLRTLLDDSRLMITEIRAARLQAGTSGSTIQSIAVQTAQRPGRIKLILKVDQPGELNEVRFYQDLASRVPISTPRVLDSRILSDGRGWVLMENLGVAKSHLDWTEQDVRSVVRDMATLHAEFWRRTDLLDGAPWLPRPDATAIGQQVETLRSCVTGIEAAGLPQVLPNLLAGPRLRLIDQVLDHAEDVLDPLLAAGTTLVHGDYWFHNVQLLADGRRVLLDWQNCRVFSGVWELVYFMDLRHVIGQRSFRAHTPELEDDVIACYLESLREHGVNLQDQPFREAVRCARIWHPLAHWLTRYGRMAERASGTTAWRAARKVPVAARLVATALASRGAIHFMESTWARWEKDSKIRFA